jgi:hypothetical protein
MQVVVLVPPAVEADGMLVIFENTAHTAFIEEPSSYLSTVADFLASADAAAKAG